MLRNIFRVMVSNFWVVVLGIINTIIFPKILSIEDYTYFQTFNLYLSYVGMLHLGFPSGMFINYGGQEYGEINKSQYKSEVNVLVLVLFSLTAIGLLTYYISGNRMVLYIALSILPLNIVATYKALYQAWGRFRVYSLMNTSIPTLITGMGLAIFLVLNNLTGSLKIETHLIVYLIASFVLLFAFYRFTSGVKSNPLFTLENLSTLRLGFGIAVGNFINSLFGTVDRQFIKMFFSSYDFAVYSFGISMQSLMTVFILAISQPIYPQLASGRLSKRNISEIKELLLVFGALAGCAYFICSIFVNLYIPKYADSLRIIEIYFTVFPAMAVINTLYINLYKVKRQTKVYIVTLSIILIISIIFNGLTMLFFRSSVAIAASTAIVYYMWLIFSSRHFEELQITKRDSLFVISFLVVYFSIARYLDHYIGLIVYSILIALISFAFYNSTILLVLRRFSSHYKKK